MLSFFPLFNYCLPDNKLELKKKKVINVVFNRKSTWTHLHHDSRRMAISSSRPGSKLKQNQKVATLPLSVDPVARTATKMTNPKSEFEAIMVMFSEDEYMIKQSVTLVLLDKYVCLD